MVDVVLTRQAESRAARTGEPFEKALVAVPGTEAGRHLRELRDGPHRHERVNEWQANVARERAEKWADASGGTRPVKPRTRPTGG